MMSKKINKDGFLFFLCVVILLGFLVFLSGCANSSAETASLENGTASENIIYPSPKPRNVKNADPYPAPGEQNTDISNQQNQFGNVKFKLNPINEGETEVTGEGPPGIFLEVFDVTFVSSLGSGVIQEDNKFNIKLAEPIPGGRIIGIQLATQRENETWSDLWELRGEGARSVPNIGYFFDSVISQPK